MTANKVKQELKKLSNLKKAKTHSRFFKTGKGEYGEGDRFLGLTVPQQRQVAKKHTALPLKEIQKLLESKIHEHRLTALFILIHQYQKGDNHLKKTIYDFYFKNTNNINNWDLVDISAPKIVGDYLLNKTPKRKILYQLAHSSNLWERRIAIISTFTFIRGEEFKDALAIAKILVNDNHDLIHKAVGWMLREIGKIDQTTEEKFLRKHYKTMPRTMLRYAIEKFNEKKRKLYLQKNPFSSCP